MKILLLSNSYLPQLGGLEVAVNRIAAEFARSGHSVTIVAGASNFSFHREPHGVRVFLLPFYMPRVVTRAGREGLIRSLWRTLLFPFIAPVSLCFLAAIIRQTRPDLVNLHYVAENGSYALACKALLNFSLVVNLHGEDIDQYGVRSKIARLLTRKVLLSANRVLTNSRDILEKARQIMPAIKNRSAVVGNGINMEEFEDAEPYRHPRKYILNIANFPYKKGQDILIRAFALLRSKGADLDLILAGEGPRLNDCKDLARWLGVDQYVIFLGRVEKKTIPSLLAGSELFVLPSRKEPFGIVVLEAFASMRPVVATNVGGIPDIIRNNENGILVAPENPAALADAIDKVLENDDLRNLLALNGHKTVTEHFTWDKICRRILPEYSKALIRSPHASH